MIRAKKKKTRHPIEKVPAMEIIKIQNRLALALMVRLLWTVYGWRTKRISEFLEGYVSLLGEVYDLRQSVDSMIDETEELTGQPIRQIADDFIRYGRDK